MILYFPSVVCKVTANGLVAFPTSPISLASPTLQAWDMTDVEAGTGSLFLRMLHLLSSSRAFTNVLATSGDHVFAVLTPYHRHVYVLT